MTDNFDFAAEERYGYGFSDNHVAAYITEDQGFQTRQIAMVHLPDVATKKMTATTELQEAAAELLLVALSGQDTTAQPRRPKNVAIEPRQFAHIFLSALTGQLNTLQPDTTIPDVRTGWRYIRKAGHPSTALCGIEPSENGGELVRFEIHRPIGIGQRVEFADIETRSVNAGLFERVLPFVLNAMAKVEQGLAQKSQPSANP